jgi:hypothetical protein
MGLARDSTTAALMNQSASWTATTVSRTSRSAALALAILRVFPVTSLGGAILSNIGIEDESIRRPASEPDLNRAQRTAEPETSVDR